MNNTRTVLTGLLALGTLWASTAPAEAASAVRHTITINGNLDHGEHGFWARLNSVSRTVTIRPWGPTKGVWEVRLRDRGTFQTLRGKNSPGEGKPITRSSTGTMTGDMTIIVTAEDKPSTANAPSSYNYRCRTNGAGNRAADCPGMAYETSQWANHYFQHITKTEVGNWSFVYRGACGQRWVNWGDASTDNSQGDIVNGCPKKVPATVPVVTQPTCLRNGTVRPGTIWTARKTGLYYEVAGTKVTPGRHTYPAGRYYVQAKAEEGYAVDRQYKSSWVYNLKNPRHCTKSHR